MFGLAFAVQISCSETSWT